MHGFWANFAHFVREFENQLTKSRGLTLLIEPAHKFESNLILTVEDCIKMISHLNSKSFGVLLDTGHINLNYEDFKEIVFKCTDIPLHIHVDDNNGDFDSHLIPGRGNINFKSIFDTLKTIEYKGFISAELGALYNLDPTAACRETLDFLKNL